MSDSIPLSRTSIDESQWHFLRPHAERDALILVDLTLDLFETAQAVAEDRAELVQGWIRQGHLRKPTADELSKWNSSPEKLFKFIVVQPYVLAREVLSH